MISLPKAWNDRVVDTDQYRHPKILNRRMPVGTMPSSRKSCGDWTQGHPRLMTERQWIEIYNNTGFGGRGSQPRLQRCRRARRYSHAQCRRLVSPPRVTPTISHGEVSSFCSLSIPISVAAAHADVPTAGRNWLSFDGTTWTGVQ